MTHPSSTLAQPVDRPAEWVLGAAGPVPVARAALRPHWRITRDDEDGALKKRRTALSHPPPWPKESTST